MPTCFVVMGFGNKTDYQTGRVLDLDKSYKAIIKPAALAAGYDCFRADEILHSGNINVPMYRQLLYADLVIADVSTYNPNAFYELGVRHALRCRPTIIIAEEKLIFPFDVGQISIPRYCHMGDGIDYDEVIRMRDALTQLMAAVRRQSGCDSPVYTFLAGLKAPSLPEGQRDLAAAQPTSDQKTVRALIDEAEASLRSSDFVTAKSLLAALHEMMPNEAFVTQRFALATYKSEQPSKAAALEEAAQILETLEPARSTDTETLGLYGSVQKRLWDEGQNSAHLDKAIWALEKGFYVKNDYYNGINLAYMLNVRAALNAESAPAEAIADFVTAERTRRKVLDLCQTALASSPKPQPENEFWILATLSQAYAGLGDDEKANELLEQAKALDLSSGSSSAEDSAPHVRKPVPRWMIQSTEEQLEKLRALLKVSPLDRITAVAARARTAAAY